MAISIRGLVWRKPPLRAAERRPRRRRGVGWVILRRQASVLGASITILLAGVAVLGPFLAPYDPSSQVLLDRLQPPSAMHWLGTDHLGRDILSRLLWGAHLTLGVGLASTTLASLLGVSIGIVAGYYTGWIDQVAMRGIDLLLALPGILLALTVIAALGSSTPNLVLAIGIGSIGGFARLSRGSTLSVRSTDYVMAARTVGVADPRILRRHILPNIAAPLIIEFTLRFSGAVLAAAALSFLGLGVRPPTAEWGVMLSEARALLRTAPHVAVIPGLAIFLAVMGLNLLGDGLRDALDPRLRR